MIIEAKFEKKNENIIFKLACKPEAWVTTKRKKLQCQIGLHVGLHYFTTNMTKAKDSFLSSSYSCFILLGITPLYPTHIA